MDRKTRAAYRRTFHRSKSIAGQALDGIFGTLITYTVIALILREAGASTAAAGFSAVLFTAVTVTVYALVTELRFERHIKRERMRIAGQIQRRALLMLTDAEFMRLADVVDAENAYLCRDSERLTAERLLEIYRSAKDANKSDITILTINGADDNAKETLRHVEDMKIDIVCADMKRVPAPSDEKIDAEFVSEVLRKRKKSFSVQPPSRYIVCGVVMLALSLVLRFSLYYRIIGIACTWIGVLKSVGGRIKAEK